MGNVLPISIIIPTFNRYESLERTLSVIDQYSTMLPAELLIIDQSRTREVQQKIQDCCNNLNRVSCDYYYLGTPSSTKARNVGIAHATSDILVFMDDDVDLNAKTLENIYSLMKDSSTAMVGAIDETLPTSGGLLGCLFALKSYKNRNIGHVTNALLGRYPQIVEGTVDTMWAMGFCFALKKQYLMKWDLAFDEKLTGYAYAEDLDLTYRYYRCARKEGLKCLLSEDVKVKHLESKEYRIPSKRNVFKYVINRKYLAYKYNEPFTTHIIMKWANFGMLLIRIMRHEPYEDILEANKRCQIVKKYLKQGVIKEEFFDDDFKFKDEGVYEK